MLLNKSLVILNAIKTIVIIILNTIVLLEFVLSYCFTTYFILNKYCFTTNNLRSCIPKCTFSDAINDNILENEMNFDIPFCFSLLL